MDLDPVQSRLVWRRAHRSIVNATRKWGKTSTTAGSALHEGAYVDGSKTVIVAPTLRQSSILLDSVAEYAEVAKIRASALKGEDPGLVLPAGVVLALPGNEATTRGHKGVTWLVVDEASRVSDAMWRSVQAFLANTNGRISLMSTPYGRRGFFWREHERAEAGVPRGDVYWELTRVTAAECPRISAEFLAEQKATQPAWWFLQEYCCEFVETESAVFGRDLVMGAMDDSVEELRL
jgi:hypothetical protein